MIEKNNPSPWVFLALVILCGAIALGVLLDGTELLNPTREKQEAYVAGTKAAMEAVATRANWAATETPLAANVQAAQTQAAIPVQATQTSQALIAQSTKIAGQQTATSVVAQNIIAVQSYNATQNALAASVQKRAIESKATQTAIAQEIVIHREQARAERIGIMLDLIGRSFFLIIPIFTTVGVIILALINARAKEKAATEKMYAEIHRTLESQAALKAKKPSPTKSQKIPSLPTIFSAKLPENGDKDLPTAA